MSPLEINLDNVEPWKGGDMLPEGKHLCRAVETEEGKSSGGHFQIEVTWEAVAGDYIGGQIRDWVVVTENSMGKVKSLLLCCGIDVPAGGFSLSADLIKGRACEIVVRPQPKPDGTPALKVVAYQAPSSDATPPAATMGTAAQPSAKAEEPVPF
jgi:hypothetical protein